MPLVAATKQWSGQYITFIGGETTGADHCIDTTDETPANLQDYDYFVLVSLTGTMIVEFSPDGTNWYPVALTPLSTVAVTPLLTTVEKEAVGFNGSFQDLRVGAGTAATGVCLVGSKLRG